MRILCTGVFTLVVILNSIDISSGTSPITRDFLQYLGKPAQDENHQKGEIIRRPTSLVLPPNFLGRTRIYLHMPDDRVFIGIFENHAVPRVPEWVLHPNPENRAAESIYVGWGREQGLVSIIHPWPHDMDINDDVHEEPRCLILSRYGDSGSAFLHRYNNQEPLPTVHPPVIFVRMPDDNTVFMGFLKGHIDRPPSWFI